MTDMPNDQWDAALYDQKYSFVFEYGRGLVSLLDPRPGERILDLGCGTGQLTRAIADAGARVVGIDSSPGMVEAARAQYPDLEFVEADARSFSFPYTFDAVFSNAVLHWILEAESVVRRVSDSLKAGGRFVAEFGGRGNVARIAGALREALREEGRADERTWWYYPTVGEYSTLLERHGLEVRLATLYDRPTRLEDGERGLRNWVEMFKGEVFEGVGADAKERILTGVENRLRGLLFKDGSWHADYRRLRVVASKL
jgi:trans-aconitate methyltransferase